MNGAEPKAGRLSPARNEPHRRDGDRARHRENLLGFSAASGSPLGRITQRTASPSGSHRLLSDHPTDNQNLERGRNNKLPADRPLLPLSEPD